MIRATCPRCGDLDVTPGAVVIDPHGYSFDCPSCGQSVTRPAARNVVDLLAHAGVRLADGIPAEVFEVKTGPLFTHDDLAALGRLLEGDDWFEELSALVHDA